MCVPKKRQMTPTFLQDFGNKTQAEKPAEPKPNSSDKINSASVLQVFDLGVVAQFL